VQHAQPGDEGMVTVRFMVSDDAIEIRVEDEGTGMDAAPAAVMPEGELSESGMGLAIIHALVDRVEIGPGVGGRGTTVRMRRLRSASPSA